MWITDLSLVGCSFPVFIVDFVLTKTGFHDPDFLHKPVNWDIEPELAIMQGLAALRVLRDNCNLTDSKVDYITKKYQTAFKEDEFSQLDYILTK